MIATCLFASLVLLAPSDAAPTVVHGAADVELLQAVRAVADKAALWRGAKFPSSLLAVRATEADRRAGAKATLASWIEPDRLAARGRAWSDLGLGSAGDAEQVYGALAADLEGMAVERDGRRLLVDAERLSEKDFGPTEGTDPAVALLLATGVRPDEPVVAHLADHALDLQVAGGEAATTTDALLAARSWAEGRANVLASRMLFEGVGAADVIHAPTFDPASVLQGALVPAAYFSGSAVARSLLYFVYGEGFAQAAGLAKDGGAAAIARAAASRKTSRDVLHPDRAPGGAAEVEVPAIVIPSGFALVDRDSLGEQGIVTLVSTATGKDNLGLLAGDGWRSDGLFRYESSNSAGESRGAGFTVWVTTWVSPTEAEDFVYCAGRVLQARFPSTTIDAAGPGRQVARAAGRVYRLDRSGETVTLRAAPASVDEALEKPKLNTPGTPPKRPKK